MSARTAEVIQIQAPIKQQIRHLDSKSQRSFPKLLNEVVRRLRKNGYKLVHVTKSYRKKGTVRSDNFWKREKRIGNIKIVWLCTLTITFKRGFKFQFDFDFWFEFSKFLQNLRGDLYESGFPHTSRSYAKKFGEREATRALKKVEGSVKREMKRHTGGWGKHGIIKDVTDRKSLDICHRKEISLSSLPELEKLRESLSELIEEPIETVRDLREEIGEVAREKLKGSIPFSIDPNSLEGFLAFFLWFRKPGGGFEYQLHRFVHENYGRIVKKKEIEDALLRLEVHGYANVEETPSNLRKKLEEKKIKRCRRFYEVGGEDIPGRDLFRALKSKANIGAYFAPLPRKRLIKQIDAPDHLVDKTIRKLTRKNYLLERKVKDFLSRSVRKIKPKRSPRKLAGLERKIVKEAEEFYRVQKDSLDQIQKGRP